MKKYILSAIALSFFTTITWVEALPRFVDVGADKCIPCVQMAPVLE